MARARATDTTALVAAAAETFRRKGYRNSTIEDIAEAANISPPTVYRYARNKQHLLDLIVSQVTGGFDQQIRAVLDADEPARARLRRLIALHVEAAIAHHTVYAIVLSDEKELSEGGREAYRAWAHGRTHDLRKLLDDCLPPQSTMNTTVAANLILSMLTTLYRWYDPSGPVPPEQLAGEMELLLSSVCAD